jgi:hypothetical protein
MQPNDDNTKQASGRPATAGPNLSSDQAVPPRPDSEIRDRMAEDAVYTDEEEALVQERLKNLGYL